MDSGSMWMVCYINCSTSDTPNPGVDFFKFALHRRQGRFKFLMMCSAAQWVRYAVHYTWPAGATIRPVLRTSILFGFVERPSNVDSTLILRVLSVIPPFVSTSKNISTDVDVLLGVRDEIESLRPSHRPECRLPLRDPTMVTSAIRLETAEYRGGPP